MTDISTITHQIMKARKARALSQTALADRLGMKQSQISSIEAGKHDLRLTTLIEVSRAVGLEIVLAPRSLLPAITYVMQTTDSQYSEQKSIYESWSEEGTEPGD
jgi:transcriptional regulator with XRE-family HTH domain